MTQRTVPLTDDQFDRLWRDHVRERSVGRVLGQAIAEATDRLVDMECEKWEAIRKMCEATGEEQMTIDWASRCIRVGGRE